VAVDEEDDKEGDKEGDDDDDKVALPAKKKKSGTTKKPSQSKAASTTKKSKANKAAKTAQHIARTLPPTAPKSKEIISSEDDESDG
jgi:BRCT domain type II-containing protein